MIFRLILPDYAKSARDYNPREVPPVIEGELDFDQVIEFNRAGYNCYWLPNCPSQYDSNRNVEGTDIDTFNFVFADMDLKDGHYASKEEFIEVLAGYRLEPTTIVDSGNGVHAYWQVSDLDVMSYLRLQRRLCRYFHTDPAIAKIYQLMRVPGTVNVKDPENPKLCEVVHSTGMEYTCEEIDQALPPISPEDETYCKLHHDKTYDLIEKIDVSDELPAKWFKFARKGGEAHKLFYGSVKDRSAADFRLAHLMLAQDFTKEEAMAVLMNTQKAATRAGVHRYNYANDIVSKVWTAVVEKSTGLLSRSVKDILSASADDDSLKGTRFPCVDYFDATVHGFRLTQVLGLIGGAGTGKTTNALNYFYWFCVLNPQYVHLFVSLEQPETEIASRWHKIANGNPALYDMVHVLGNYNDDGTYRNMSIQEIEDYVKLLEKETGKKVGCVVIDHIGVLKQETKDGEFQGLMNICKYLKAFAVNTNTFLVMQSQAPREKAGIGDIELDKDAAFGTSQFEWYCDYIVTTWQPLKRVYAKAPHMTVTCYKYCKIRHKDTKRDKIQEDTRYALMFDPDTELLRPLNDDEKKAYDFFAAQATALRKRDKKTDPGEVSDLTWVATKREKDGRDNTHRKDS
jgi:hypothetical protein